MSSVATRLQEFADLFDEELRHILLVAYEQEYRHWGEARSPRGTFESLFGMGEVQRALGSNTTPMRLRNSDCYVTGAKVVTISTELYNYEFLAKVDPEKHEWEAAYYLTPKGTKQLRKQRRSK